MSKAINHHTLQDSALQDKTIMRRLALAVGCMCIGALGLVVLAITVGRHFH